MKLKQPVGVSKSLLRVIAIEQNHLNSWFIQERNTVMLLRDAKLCMVAVFRIILLLSKRSKNRQYGVQNTSILINFLFFEKTSTDLCNHAGLWRKNSTLRVMLIYYMKWHKYIHFLPLYLQFCDHSKRILTDRISQWKKALQMHTV